jgi:hypothetical protein
MFFDVIVDAGAKGAADVLVDDSVGADVGTIADDLLLAVAGVQFYGLCEHEDVCRDLPLRAAHLYRVRG